MLPLSPIDESYVAVRLIPLGRANHVCHLCGIVCLKRVALDRAAPVQSQEHNLDVNTELKRIIGVEHRPFRPQSRNLRIMAIGVVGLLAK
jgi:hypothetical protein